MRRVSEIGQDIERLIPTAGDAFAMTAVNKAYDERKIAGRALMKQILTLLQLQHAGEILIASIGGFDLIYHGERFAEGNGYRFQTLLQGTGADYDIDLDVTVTPVGAISRVEHALDGFEEEQQRYRHRLNEARRRLASYRSRQGGTFSFGEELAEKRRQLQDVEETLAKSARDDSETGGIAA